MGDVIREETRRRGLEPNERNTGQVMLELREKYGFGAVAEVCIASLKGARDKVVIVDGVRSFAEVQVFAREGTVRVLAVHASRERRFKLLIERGRGDAPASREAFDERDRREISVGVGGAVALADEIISNEHIAPEELEAQAIRIVESWAGSSG